jgi:short-subunit dehydrogenase
MTPALIEVVTDQQLSSQAEYEVFDYRGSTALVTGASRGVGEVFAEHLAERGMNLVLVGRSVDALESLAKRLSGKYAVRCVALNLDLADSDVTDWIAAELERRGIQVDLLVNNAGSGLIGGFVSHGRKQKEAEVWVNVQALVCLTWRFARGMKDRRRGGIINIASNAGSQRLPAMAPYAAARAFVLHFGEALSYELAGYGVHVMAACPGPKNIGGSVSVVQRTLEAFDQGKTIAYPTRISLRLGMSYVLRRLVRV